MLLHNQRFNQSRRELWKCDDYLDLRPFINPPEELKSGLVKCRIIYNSEIEEIQYSAYQPRIITSVKMISDNHISYDHKFELRPQLDRLLDFKGKHGEILIIKNDYLTDAYYFNIVLLQNKKLFTPAKPLLKGIQRAYLLNSGKIQERDIHINTLDQYDSLFLINAMTPLGKIKIPIDHIYS